jgi:hypothetical protein
MQAARKAFSVLLTGADRQTIVCVVTDAGNAGTLNALLICWGACWGHQHSTYTCKTLVAACTC